MKLPTWFFFFFLVFQSDENSVQFLLLLPLHCFFPTLKHKHQNIRVNWIDRQKKMNWIEFTYVNVDVDFNHIDWFFLSFFLQFKYCTVIKMINLLWWWWWLSTEWSSFLFSPSVFLFISLKKMKWLTLHSLYVLIV